MPGYLIRNSQMMHAGSLRLLAILLACWSVPAVAATYGIGDCNVAYMRCLAAWKSDRLGKLKGEEGYLNLAGLFWLGQGTNTFGSGAP